MKTYLIISMFLFSLNSNAKCLDISGIFLMENASGGIPNCGAGEFSKKVWRKYLQTDCKSVSISKIYKLKNGEICEGSSSIRTADGSDYQNEGSDYVFSYVIANDDHTLNLKNTVTGLNSKLVFAINADGNMVQTVDYLNGTKETIVLLRTKVQ